MYAPHTHYKNQANVLGLFIDLHPDFTNWYPEWRIIRDAMECEKAVK
jgi:hypothetical protein